MFNLLLEEKKNDPFAWEAKAKIEANVSKETSKITRSRITLSLVSFLYLQDSNLKKADVEPHPTNPHSSHIFTLIKWVRPISLSVLFFPRKTVSHQWVHVHVAEKVIKLQMLCSLWCNIPRSSENMSAIRFCKKRADPIFPMEMRLLESAYGKIAIGTSRVLAGYIDKMQVDVRKRLKNMDRAS